MILCEFCDHFASFKYFDEDCEEDIYVCKCCYKYAPGPCRGRDVVSQTIVRV